VRKNIEISNEKINEFLEQFYGYFESGYAFEEFLKVYLEKMRLLSHSILQMVELI
jgi:restriction system protein